MRQFTDEYYKRRDKAWNAQRRKEQATQERRRDDIRQNLRDAQATADARALEHRMKEDYARAEWVREKTAAGLSPKQIYESTPQDRNPYKHSYKPMEVRHGAELGFRIAKLD